MSCQTEAVVLGHKMKISSWWASFRRC